jgi:hypothetical protein
MKTTLRTLSCVFVIGGAQLVTQDALAGGGAGHVVSAEVEAAREPPEIGTIEVSVVDVITRASVTQWPVQLDCDCLEKPQLATSDDEGRVTFTGLPPGTYTLTDPRGRGVAPIVLKSDASSGARAEHRIGAQAPERSDERFAAGTLTWAGVGVVGIGATLLTGGVMASAVNPCNRDGANAVDCRRDLRAGLSIALATTGALTTAAGATMIGVGRARRLALGPTLSFRRGGGAVGIRGRF